MARWNLQKIFMSPANLFRVVSCVLHGGIVLGILGCEVDHNRQSLGKPTELLDVRLVSPAVPAGSVIPGDRRQRVTLKWNVRNISGVSLEGIKLGLDCQCRLASELPQVLKPDDSCQIVLNFPSPVAGRASRKIPVMASHRDSPIAYLTFTIETPYTEGIWVHCPKKIFIQGVEGQAVESRLMIQRIEKLERPPYFSTVSLQPTGIGTVDWEVSSKEIGEDGQHCRRDYHLVVRISDFRKHEGDVTLCLSGPLSETLSIPCELTVRPRLRIVPAKLRLAPGKKRMVLALAADHTAVRIGKYDKQLILITQEGNPEDHPARFVIECIKAPENSNKTFIGFLTSGGATQNLPVEIARQ